MIHGPLPRRPTLREKLDALEEDEAMDDIDELIHLCLRQGYGPRRLRGELQRCKLAASTIDRCTAKIDWRKQAEAVRQQVFGRQHPRTTTERTPQLWALAGRGFPVRTLKGLF